MGCLLIVARVLEVQRTREPTPVCLLYPYHRKEVGYCEKLIDLPFTLCKLAGESKFPDSKGAFGLGPLSLFPQVYAWCHRDQGERALRIRELSGVCASVLFIFLPLFS